MSRVNNDDPNSYKGPRTPIIKKHPCGFCNSGDHDKCCHEIPYFEKLWICPCTCNKNWVPKDLGTATIEKPKRGKKNGDKGRTSGDDSISGDGTGGGEPMAGSEIPDAVGDPADPEQLGE